MLTRPIPAAVVLDALPAACEVDSALCRRVQRYLERYAGQAGLAEASVELGASTDQAIALPNAHGRESDSAWQVSARGYWQPNPYVLLSAGGVAYDGGGDPSGSVLSFGLEYAQLDIGYRDHWLSPFTQHAMLISTQAETLPSVTISNYTPITQLGFQYEIFLAEMEHSDRIRIRNGFTSGEPSLTGLHVSIEPARGWTLGLNRVVQTGGGARGGRSFSDFLDALIDPEEFDEGGNISLEGEFGNQVAAWTSRFIFPGRTPFAVYLEYAGEDRAYEGNYRSFSNAALSMGIDIPQLWGVFDLTYEVSEWQNSWYIHHIYRDGLIHDGHVLGHWGGDARQLRNAVGAQSHVLRLGWAPEFGGWMQVRARTVANEEYLGVSYDRGYDLTIAYSRNIGGHTIGAEIMGGSDVFGDSFGRLAGFVRVGADWAEGSTRSVASARDSEGAEIFVDAGLNANRMRVTLDAVSATRSGVDTDLDIAPHLGVGARRAVSRNHDLGVRAEFDQIDGRLLIGVRALDYRYRFGTRFAVSAFLGAARYDLATTALGYYGGFGVQVRDALPRTDIALDVRYADKITRDKLLPNDAPRSVRPDSFYDIASIALYASYKW